MHFICVGTPQSEDRLAADLGAVEAAVQALVRSLRRDAAIVGTSTVPVGTADRLAAGVAAVVRPGLKVSLSWNPEFLREGHAVSLAEVVGPFFVTHPDEMLDRFHPSGASYRRTARALLPSMLAALGYDERVPFGHHAPAPLIAPRSEPAELRA